MKSITERAPYLVVGTLTFFSACAEQLMPNPLDAERTTSGPASEPLAEIPAQSGNFIHGGRGEAVVTVVDATNYEEFQLLDFDSGIADTPGWDLAFRRFLVVSNGGVSGDGSVQIVKLASASFDEIDTAPSREADWLVDRPDGATDEDAFADTAFNDGVDDWYDYDQSDHSLTTKGYVYLIRSTERRYYKLSIESYYDDVGTSGIVTFSWQEIDPPEEEIPDQDLPDEPGVTPREPSDDPDELDDANEPDDAPGYLVVDASSYDDFVYVGLTDGLVMIEDPTQSSEWDLAIRRYVWLTNSGTSGPGLGGAKLDDSGLEFEELEVTTPHGFVVDEILPASGAPGSTEGTGNAILEAWYDYEGLGQLAPKEETFLVRTASGGYAKLRIHSYSGGLYEMTFLPIEGQN